LCAVLELKQGLSSVLSRTVCGKIELQGQETGQYVPGDCPGRTLSAETMFLSRGVQGYDEFRLTFLPRRATGGLAFAYV
jgi:hypothetical protein